MKETHPPKAEDTTHEYYLKNLGIVDLETNNWTWYVTGANRVAKITPLPHQQPAAIDSGDTTLNDNLYSSFYLYDLPIHIGIGNTRIVYTPTVQCPGYVFDTIDYVADYYPYGKTLRQYTNGPTEKFLTTQHERDAETGLDYRGARFYDSDVARFLSLDPLARKFAEWSDYCYVLSNPIKYVDTDGRDTLVMHRSAPIERYTEADNKVIIYKISYSLIRNGEETEIGGEMYLMGNKKHAEIGDNGLNEDSYTLSWDQLTSFDGTKGWENTIRVTGFGVFIHPGNYYFSFRGCYGISSEEPVIEDHGGGVQRVALNRTVDALQEVRDLFESVEESLTGDKFILRTNSNGVQENREDIERLPLPKIKPIPTSSETGSP